MLGDVMRAVELIQEFSSRDFVRTKRSFCHSWKRWNSIIIFEGNFDKQMAITLGILAPDQLYK